MQPECYGAAIYIFWTPGPYRIFVSPGSSLAVLRDPPLLLLDGMVRSDMRKCAATAGLTYEATLHENLVTEALEKPYGGTKRSCPVYVARARYTDMQNKHVEEPGPVLARAWAS